MEVRVLGAHQSESTETRFVSLLVDDVLAIDAGSLTTGLPLADQRRVRSVLLTHQHYDHVKDLGVIGYNILGQQVIDVYGPVVVHEALSRYIFNGEIWLKLFEGPQPEAPTLRFTELVPYQEVQIDGYRVLPVPMATHAVPELAYQVTSADGRRLFYTGDTGPGCSAAWPHVAPHLLITEVTFSNELEDLATRVGHLTPRLFGVELERFGALKGYLPEVVVVHMNPHYEDVLARELAELAPRLGASITVGREGMRVRV